MFGPKFIQWRRKGQRTSQPRPNHCKSPNRVQRAHPQSVPKQVQGPSMNTPCPFCNDTARSTVLSVPVDHRSACRHQFCVHAGSRFSSRAYEHACCTCGTIARRRTNSNKAQDPAGKTCRRKSWQSLVSLVACATQSESKTAAAPVPKVGFATPKHYGREETHGFGLRLQVLNFASRTEKPSSKLQLSNLQNVLFPHTKTPCHWRDGQAFGVRLPLPNVAFWTDKKRAPNCSLQASKPLASPQRNTMPRRDAPGLRPVAASA